MPELPEIRAHARRLAHALDQVALERFEPLSFTALKTVMPPPDVTHGKVVRDVTSRGKHLLLDVDAATFVVHLMQGGRLRFDTSKAKRPRYGVARWHLVDGRRLLLTEAGTERRAGVWVVEGAPDSQEPLAELGPEADAVTLDELRARLSQRSMRLHGFLRDQRALAGIGRRLANEICHRAQLSPFAQTGSLDEAQTVRLHAAITGAVAEGLAFEDARDEMSASKDRPAAVHHRTGEPCPVCGDQVREVAYQRYTVHYCATCQTGGRVLADNTTSKFLK